MSETKKQSYLSPAAATLELSVVRNAQPFASIVLDLGIPKFTVFSIKFPLPPETASFPQVASEALAVMLDEMTAFMISTGYDKKTIAEVYALALSCYQDMISRKQQNEMDPALGSVRGEFPIPMEFVNETQRQIITASNHKVNRVPRERKLEFVPARPTKPSKNDILKAIRQYRFQSIKNQPYPMYLVVYDNMGNAKGTLSLGPGFHNELLKMQYGEKKAQLQTLDDVARKQAASFSEDIDEDESREDDLEWMGDFGTEGGFEEVRKQDFDRHDQDDEYYYHVTTRPRAIQIMKEGLIPGRARSMAAGGFYAQYASGKTFFSERSGVSYWLWTVERHLEHDYDNPPRLTVIRFPKSMVKDVKVDEVGSDDSMQPSYYTTKPILPQEEPEQPWMDSELTEKFKQAAEYSAEQIKEMMAQRERKRNDPKALARQQRKIDELKAKYERDKASLSERQTEWEAQQKDYISKRDDAMAASGVKPGDTVEYSIAGPFGSVDYFRGNLTIDKNGKPVVVSGRNRRPWHKGYFKVSEGHLSMRADYTDTKGYWAGAGGAASGILPVCSSTGRVGLAWRSPYVQRGNCWGTIGGAVIQGMNPSQSAKHELAEETGYKGAIKLYPAYVFTDGRFKYYNFVGEVSHEFGLNPMEGESAGMEFSEENEALEWFDLDELIVEMKENSHEFHPGVLTLFKNSGDLIRQVAGKAKPKTAGTEYGGSKVEQAVDSAIENEAVGLTRRQRDQEFRHHLNAWNNANIYADMFGIPVEDFKNEMIRRGIIIEPKRARRPVRAGKAKE